MASNSGVIKNAEIRMLSESDIDAFWQLRLRMLKEEPESFAADYEESTRTSMADVSKQLRGADGSFILGAFAPNLVGMIGFYRQSGIKMCHKGVVWGMYVAPENRGNSLGKALLLAAISRASTMPELKQLMLTVVTTRQTARNLYLSLGFRSYGVEPSALKLGNRYCDEELMMLKLNRE